MLTGNDGYRRTMLQKYQKNGEDDVGAKKKGRNFFLPACIGTEPKYNFIG
jgi:hypothetical protein